MYACNICHERWDRERDTCPMCGATEIESTKRAGGRRKSEPVGFSEFEYLDADIEEPIARPVTCTSEPTGPLRYPTTLVLGAKEWENITLEAIKLEREHKTLTGNRYGVDCRPMPSKKHRGEIEWTPVSSLPDFEGVLMNGPQFVIENKKVASRKSLPLNDDKLKKRQLAHMFDRDEFGGICFLLVHFNPRELKAGSTDSETFAFPVSKSHPFWMLWELGKVKSLTPEHCGEFGYRVPWGAKYRSRTMRPLILETVQAMANMREQGWPKMCEQNEIHERVDGQTPF